jgi:putative transposase
MIESGSRIPVVRQCALLSLSRSTAYYRPQGVSEADLELMRLIDEIHLEFPFFGSRRIRGELEDRGHRVNRKRVQRLMRLMGLEALYPKPTTTKPAKGHKIYPYRLKGLTIDRPNQVWAADLCYIPMAKGFMYLVAIMDWHSRKVLSLRSSTPIRGRNSPPRRSPARSSSTISPSAWTARAGGWTTSLWKDYGAASSMRTST